MEIRRIGVENNVSGAMHGIAGSRVDADRRLDFDATLQVEDGRILAFALDLEGGDGEGSGAGGDWDRQALDLAGGIFLSGEGKSGDGKCGEQPFHEGVLRLLTRRDPGAFRVQARAPGKDGVVTSA